LFANSRKLITLRYFSTLEPRATPLSGAVLKDASSPSGQTAVFGSAVKETLQVP